MNEFDNQPEAQKKYITCSYTFSDPWLGEDTEAGEVKISYRFAKPSKNDMQRFTKSGQKSLSAAQNNLIISLIHPDDKDKFLSESENYPGILTSVTEWLIKASGYASLGN